MGCPVTPLSCLEPANIFAGVFSPVCGGFADPSKFQAERALYNSGFSELINNFGVDIDYYIHTYNLSAANNFYGEHTTAPYYGPIKVRAYVEYAHNSVPLQVYGWEPDDTVTLYLHINNFTSSFNSLSVYPANGQRVEPKADDGFVLVPFGCDRPSSRSAKHFVVTQVIDEDSSTINPLAGHYVWKVNAKRFDHSFEAGFKHEDDNVEVYDNSFSGVLSSNILENDGETLTAQLSSAEKTYNFDVDEYVKENIFNNKVNDTSMYGNYF